MQILFIKSILPRYSAICQNIGCKRVSNRLCRNGRVATNSVSEQSVSISLEVVAVESSSRKLWRQQAHLMMLSMLSTPTAIRLRRPWTAAIVSQKRSRPLASPLTNDSWILFSVLSSFFQGRASWGGNRGEMPRPLRKHREVLENFRRSFCRVASSTDCSLAPCQSQICWRCHHQIVAHSSRRRLIWNGSWKTKRLCLHWTEGAIKQV